MFFISHTEFSTNFVLQWDITLTTESSFISWEYTTTLPTEISTVNICVYYNVRTLSGAKYWV